MCDNIFVGIINSVLDDQGRRKKKLKYLWHEWMVFTEITVPNSKITNPFTSGGLYIMI